MTAFARSWYPLGGAPPRRRSRASAGSAAARKPAPIDPLSGPKLALAGRVVTMDDAFNVVRAGVVYIDRGAIVAVRRSTEPVPEGFEAVRRVETGGTLYPGLIDLHNHLSYNALPLWSPVPRQFEHRGQWPEHPDYRKLISGPMTVVGKYLDDDGKSALLAPLVRYVECKCLLGGVTTSQGIMLNSNSGVRRYYRGVVRNVEQTDDPDLIEAQARIDDIDAKDARSFRAKLNKQPLRCFLLHLSEGVTRPGDTESVARRHFLALQVAPHEWALNERFTGIHATGLLGPDYDVLAEHWAAIVWSPLSNLLLYGATARVEEARRASLRIGLGSDWSPSGSKNLLGELKVAWLYSQTMLGALFTARDLVAMATRNAAAILRWENALGSLEAGKRADIVVIDGRSGDPYEALIKASEASIRLVIVNGVARYGTPALMSAFGASGESLTVGGERRRLFLEQATADPVVASLSLSQATSSLRAALADLPRLALQLEKPKPAKAMRAALDARESVVWSLALDEVADTGVDLRPRLPLAGPRDLTGPGPIALAAPAPPLSKILEPIALDPLTVVDDSHFLTQIANQPNIPAAIRSGLMRLY
jgi:hypothetical protein